MEATYRLKRIVGGLPHWAEVTLRAEPADQNQVIVSDDVFGWRCAVYGPDARTDGPEEREFVTSAADGVRYALARIGAAGTLVTIEAIHNASTDTGPDDVKFAAVAATCRALDVELDRPPTIEPHGVIFPPVQALSARIAPPHSARQRTHGRESDRTPADDHVRQGAASPADDSAAR